MSVGLTELKEIMQILLVLHKIRTVITGCSFLKIPIKLLLIYGNSVGGMFKEWFAVTPSQYVSVVE